MRNKPSITSGQQNRDAHFLAAQEKRFHICSTRFKLAEEIWRRLTKLHFHYTQVLILLNLKLVVQCICHLVVSFIYIFSLLETISISYSNVTWHNTIYRRKKYVKICMPAKIRYLYLQMPGELIMCFCIWVLKNEPIKNRYISKSNSVSNIIDIWFDSELLNKNAALYCPVQIMIMTSDMMFFVLQRRNT